MNNNLVQIKIKQRLNKLSSSDYDNIECWQIQEAFNKAQLEWVRRQLNGVNLRKDGDEQSTTRVDDLQFLITHRELTGTNKKEFFQTTFLPDDYLRHKRVTAYAKSECCPERKMVCYQAEEGDVDVLLTDSFSCPDFDWAETFYTFSGNNIKVYTKDFKVTTVQLSYYRLPKNISIEGCINVQTQEVGKNVECEFKDDVVELIIDEAASILAGDIESQIQIQRGVQNAERNN
jgi:hypothetical protein